MRAAPSGKEKNASSFRLHAMALFVIIPVDSTSPNLDTAVQSKFGNAAFKLPRGEWLVSYDGTTRQLSDVLQISGGELGVNAVVLAFNAHWGRASASVWEWIAANQQKQA